MADISGLPHFGGHLIDWEQGVVYQCMDLIMNLPTNLWLETATWTVNPTYQH